MRQTSWNLTLPFKPESIVGEILGEVAYSGIDPSKNDHLCPFINSRCSKRSTSLKTEPYPVCSIWKGREHNPIDNLICVCPKRFYAADFLSDVITNCWPGDPPRNPQIAHEVQMKGFGNVDFVLADVDSDGAIGQFLSVELQAIDITGSVMPAYLALRNGTELDQRPRYGLNWDNVYKRYITQLIRKGYFHHHWKTKIVAVIQEQIYRNILERADFMRSSNVKDATVNIIFMTYRFEDDLNRPGQFKPVLTTVEGTSHSALSQAILYKEAPSRDQFCDQIKRSLIR
ncbi:MAG: NotI family restriction endonuclease [Parvibaculum sp.]